MGANPPHLSKYQQRVFEAHQPKTARAAMRLVGLGRRSVRLLVLQGLVSNDMWPDLPGWSIRCAGRRCFPLPLINRQTITADRHVCPLRGWQCPCCAECTRACEESTDHGH